MRPAAQFISSSEGAPRALVVNRRDS